MSPTHDCARGCVQPGADLGDALVRLMKTIERTGAQLAGRRGDGLEKAAFRVLFTLLDRPRRSSALAEDLQADPSTVSRHVGHLVALGHVARTADPGDGRATVLTVTDSGRAVAGELRRRRNATIEAATAGWSGADRAHLTALLTRFTHDLEHHRTEGHPA